MAMGSVLVEAAQARSMTALASPEWQVSQT